MSQKQKPLTDAQVLSRFEKLLRKRERRDTDVAHVYRNMLLNLQVIRRIGRGHKQGPLDW